MLQPFHFPRPVVTLAAGLLAMTACSKGDSSSTPASTDAAAPAASSSPSGEEDLATVTNYRLSMDKIDKYMAAQRNLAMKAKDMSPAERAAMEARGDDAGNADASLDDMTKKIESEPIMVAAIKDAGLSPREFTLITISMMQSGMAAAVAKMRPRDNQDSLIRAMKANPENVKFYNEHEAEITQKGKALQAEMEKLGLSDR
jgi:hypothetical protein